MIKNVNYKKIYVTALTLIVLFSAVSVLAEPINGGTSEPEVLQTDPSSVGKKTTNKISYVPLEPDAFKGLATEKPTGNPLADFLGQVFSFGIAAAVVLALIMIIYAGIQKMTTDSVFNQEEAKSTINNALYGLGLALVSYIILYTINPCLVVYTAGKQCVTQNTFLYGTTPVSDYGPSLPGDESAGVGTGNITNASKANPNFNDGVGIYSSNPDGVCFDKSNPRCTSAEGLPDIAITSINSLDNICGGCITITGGTEIGHEVGYQYNHNPGNATVDLRYNKETIEALKTLGLIEGEKESFKTKNKLFVCEIGESSIVKCDQTPDPEHIHVQF